jgi:transposase
MAPLTEADIATIEKQLQKGKWVQDLVNDFLVDGRGSRTAIYRFTRRWEQTGTVAPEPKQIGRPPTITVEENEWLLEQLRQNSNLTMSDLQTLLLTERNVRCSMSSLSRALKRCGGKPKYRRVPKKKTALTTAPALDPQLSGQREQSNEAT